MGWFTRIDRFGDTHLCFSQEEAQSCGLASAKMVVFKVNKLRPGHAALVTEAKVEQIYKKYDDTAVKVGNEGVFVSDLAKVLNELGVGAWRYLKPPAHKVTNELLAALSPDLVGLGPINTALRGYPVVLGIDWGGGGGHVVVLDTITKLPLINAWWGAMCDPGDGDVHITRMRKDEPIQYEGRRVTFSFNAWGSPEINYKQGKTSQGIVTEIVYCEKPPASFS